MNFDLNADFFELLPNIEYYETDPTKLHKKIDEMSQSIKHLAKDLRDEKNKFGIERMKFNDEITKKKADKNYVEHLEKEVEKQNQQIRSLIKTNQGLILNGGAIGEKNLELQEKINQLEKENKQYQNLIHKPKYADAETQPSNENSAETFKIMNMATMDKIIKNFELMVQVIIPAEQEHRKLLEKVKTANEAQIQQLKDQTHKLWLDLMDYDLNFKVKVNEVQKNANDQIKQHSLNQCNERAQFLAEKNKLLAEITKAQEDYTKLNEDYMGSIQNGRALEERVQQCLDCIKRYEDRFNPKHYYYEGINCIIPELNELHISNNTFLNNLRYYFTFGMG
jgi:DNA repair exonuclease SbcCD ATPase subunit